ncbi:Putative Adenosinetriphosphatase [Rhizopus microsporus]|nr:Putative Adenosinetriphosphatase [Rhizopus microsporus]
MNNNNNLPSTSTTAVNNNVDLDLASLTKEKLNLALQRAKQLQAAGEKEDGKNEFSQLMNFLRTLHRQQSIAFQHLQQTIPNQPMQPPPQPARPPIQQQQQQQQQQFSTTPPPMQNPMMSNGNQTPTQLQMQQMQIQLLQQHLMQQQLSNNVNTANSDGAMNNAFQYQMLAYNLLSQNLANNNAPMSSMPVKSEGMTAPTLAIQTPNDPAGIIGQDQIINTAGSMVSEQPSAPPKTMAERLVDVIYLQAVEYNRIKQDKKEMTVTDELNEGLKITAHDLLYGHDRSHAHSSRQQRLLLPERLPAGLDPLTVLSERERRIEKRAAARLKELETLTDEQNNARDEEQSDELDDEELNTILKRSDQEYAIFTKIDLERQRTDLEDWKRKYGENSGKKPERLIQEWELPEIYRNDAMLDMYEADPLDSVFGRGQRVKETVVYSDSMTDRQWLRQIEREEDDEKRALKRAKY